MNIFAVDNDPCIAARSLPDKLIVKMPTESIQLLIPWVFNTYNIHIYKQNKSTYGVKGFAFHPCAKWLYESTANALWLFEHAKELTEEYTRRYKRIHGVDFALCQLSNAMQHLYASNNSYCHTTFAQAMPNQFKIPGNPITAYRNYINRHKGYAEWRHGPKPKWWNDLLHEPVRNKYLEEQRMKKQMRVDLRIMT